MKKMPKRFSQVTGWFSSRLKNPQRYGVAMCTGTTYNTVLPAVVHPSDCKFWVLTTDAAGHPWLGVGSPKIDHDNQEGLVQVGPAMLDDQAQVVATRLRPPLESLISRSITPRFSLIPPLVDANGLLVFGVRQRGLKVDDAAPAESVTERFARLRAHHGAASLEDATLSLQTGILVIADAPVIMQLWGDGPWSVTVSAPDFMGCTERWSWRVAVDQNKKVTPPSVCIPAYA